jgi:hypothetical protein
MFLLFLLDDGYGYGSVQIMTNPIREVKKLENPTDPDLDPDPQNCLNQLGHSSTTTFSKSTRYAATHIKNNQSKLIRMLVGDLRASLRRSGMVCSP